MKVWVLELGVCYEGTVEITIFAKRPSNEVITGHGKAYQPEHWEQEGDCDWSTPDSGYYMELSEHEVIQ